MMSPGTRSRDGDDRSPAAIDGAVRSLLAALEPLGWCRISPPRRITGRRAAGSVPHLIATLGSRSLVLAELAPGREFPRHAERRTLFTRCRASLPQVAVVLVDAAWIRRIWMWESALLAGLFREVREPLGRHAVGETAAMVMREWCVAEPHQRPRAASAAIHSRLAERLGDSTAGTRVRRSRGSPGATVLRYATGAETPRETMTVWNALRELKLTDAECREGDWLLEGVRTLQPLYAATLQRMAGFDLDRQTVGDPPALPRGIRVALAGAGGPALPRLRVHVQLTTLLYNVTGASSDPAALRIARLRLARALATDSVEENRLIALVLRQRLVSTAPGLSREAVAGRPEAERRDGEAVLLGRAFEVIRELHLTRRAAPRELAAGYRALEKRSAAMTARWDDEVAASGAAWLRLRFPGHRGSIVTPEDA